MPDQRAAGDEGVGGQSEQVAEQQRVGRQCPQYRWQRDFPVKVQRREDGRRQTPAGRVADHPQRRAGQAELGRHPGNSAAFQIHGGGAGKLPQQILGPLLPYDPIPAKDGMGSGPAQPAGQFRIGGEAFAGRQNNLPGDKDLAVAQCRLQPACQAEADQRLSAFGDQPACGGFRPGLAASANTDAKTEPAQQARFGAQSDDGPD